MKSNLTDRITVLYNLIVIVFIAIFRAEIDGYAYHLAFNLSAILLVLLLSLQRETSTSFRIMSLWYPVVLYALFYYQT